MKLARLTEIEKLLSGWMEGCKSFLKDCSKQSKSSSQIEKKIPHKY